MALSLETPRLILREFQPEDWSRVQAYARDPEVVRFQPWGPNSEAETQAYVARAMALAAQTPRQAHELAVVFKPSGVLIGGATLNRDAADSQSAELGYTLHRLAWGQGLGTELARRLVDFGFRDLELRRIWAKCRPENVGSYRVMKKAGLRLEEYLQNDLIVRGRAMDSFLCSITRREWEAASAGPGKDC
jgi:RimJ/RimL family protein N-acetyltransferase